MIKDLIMDKKSIEVKDLLLEAKEQQHKVTVTIGYIEISGLIEKINDNSFVIKSEELDIGVVF